MKIIYGKTLTAEEFNLVGNIASQCSITFDTARLLFYRNIDTVSKAKAFLTPGKHGLIDPFKLKGVQDAVDRIALAKERGENVLIFGDYDADGVCATTVLYYCLSEFGITARFTVPEREEGYGLNLDKIEKLNGDKSIDLIITVDCGISDAEKIAALKNKGIDVIVTDHHEPPEVLPETICINPKIAGQSYGFTELCGAGVSYKLGYALIGEAADKYLDFVCLATVADSMDLVGENRDIVTLGLKLFNDKNTLRLPFKHLLGVNGKQVNSQTIAYNVAPRINAGGRMGDAAAALKLFTETDENKIFDLAAKLSEYNIARQVECDKIYQQAKAKIESTRAYKNNIILVADDNWKPGFVGIVAAKLVEDYSRPVIVFAGYDGYYKGSARSVDGFNVYDAINAVKDVLVAYGGHSQAAGVSVHKENFERLDKLINEYVESVGVKLDFEQKIYAEWNVEKPVSMRFAKEMELLEPFGVGNKKPLFTTTVKSITSLPLKSGSQHYTFKTPVIEMLDFGGENHVKPLYLPNEKSVVFEINLSSFKGRESLKGYVRTVVNKLSDSKELRLHIFQNQLKGLLTDEYAVPQAIDENQVKVERGTVYVLSDAKNLERYPQLKNLPVSVCYPSGRTPEVVYAPLTENIIAEKLVYLDKPMQPVNFKGETKVCENLCGYNIVERLSTDRSDFARIFTKLTALSGKLYKDSVSFASFNVKDEDIYQTIFVLETFLELQIFKLVGGKFVYDQKVKNALTNSKVYSKIYILKG